ncbi:MAG: RIP metalloprotease RseP [Proteobacteria bacterium]|nr:MAG: RIP metalloprotease RseP [Pseudomonadota bacterium]
MNINNLLVILPVFLVTIGILVTVHEFGHFWVARKLGVKVLRFSVGFGKPLWMRVSQKDQTEYVVAALPLGGYVKMLDEREGDVPEDQVHLAFNRQSVWKRMAIVVAGPVANFILAILLYALTFMTGNPAMTPLVEAQANSPAAVAGFAAGDKITAINDQAVASWEEARMLLLDEYLNNPVLQVTVQTQAGQQKQLTLDLSQQALLKDEGDFLAKSGLGFWSPELDVLIAALEDNSPAAQAGLLAGDKVLSLDGKKPANPKDFVDYIRDNVGQTLEIQVQRSSGITTIHLTPATHTEKGEIIGRIGAHIGVDLPAEWREKMEFTQYFGPIDSLVLGVKKTWQTSVLTLKLMGRMLVGEVSLKNISGPITIARFSGETAVAGLPYYLSFLAVVSLSLGILNLLPIPMLDGGHLLYYFIEIVKGSPVSARAEAFGLRFGMAIVASIMVLALYNDFMRLLN